MDRYSDAALPRSGLNAHSRMATTFLVTVYMWMFVGLSLTAVVAWMVAGSESLVLSILGNRAILYGLFIAEILLVVGLTAAINRISAMTAMGLFLLYSALNGATMSVVFVVFTGESVLMAFLSAACLFGTMSLYGYITKRDLTAWGNLLMVGLIAVVLCSVINLFLGSSRFDFVISVVGVVVFLGLTAYDTQKILSRGAGLASVATEAARKAAILGALALYLDFVNLFLYMLRFMGKRK